MFHLEGFRLKKVAHTYGPLGFISDFEYWNCKASAET